jgi:hypothetical protein
MQHAVIEKPLMLLALRDRIVGRMRVERFLRRGAVLGRGSGFRPLLLDSRPIPVADGGGMSMLCRARCIWRSAFTRGRPLRLDAKEPSVKSINPTHGLNG